MVQVSYADSSGNVRIFKDSDNFITFGSSGMNITTERINLTATNLTASSDSEFLHLGPPTRVDGNNWESSKVLSLVVVVSLGLLVVLTPYNIVKIIMLSP